MCPDHNVFMFQFYKAQMQTAVYKDYTVFDTYEKATIETTVSHFFLHYILVLSILNWIPSKPFNQI